MPARHSRWNSAKASSRAGFDWAWKKLDKISAPVNRSPKKVGSEAFWPSELGHESDKASRILQSFCQDGFYEEVDGDQTFPRSSRAGRVDAQRRRKIVKKIPPEVIKNAVGLCIFTTMRAGLWMAGAGGSGVLLARLSDGSWSPPSGVLLHTAGLGFLVGVDIYDCVIVINTPGALSAFMNPRLRLEGELSAVAGPRVDGNVLHSKILEKQTPIWYYIKSRGLYTDVKIDGAMIIERNDENERFYGKKISANDILGGIARGLPQDVKMLMETVRSIQGDTEIDAALLPKGEPTPGDYSLTEPDSVSQKSPSGFGVPQPDDPDPFGVRALQNTGLDIYEAGTGAKPEQKEFEYRPTPTSPIFPASKDMWSGTSSMNSLVSKDNVDTVGQAMDRASVERSTQVGGLMEADIGAEGTNHLREAAELEARREIFKDELATPNLETLLDPIDFTGPELDKVYLTDAEVIIEVRMHPTGGTSVGEPEIAYGKSG